MYGGKFVVGIGLGQMSVIAPAYCAEVSRPESRGKLPLSVHSGVKPFICIASKTDGRIL